MSTIQILQTHFVENKSTITHFVFENKVMLIALAILASMAGIFFHWRYYTKRVPNLPIKQLPTVAPPFIYPTKEKAKEIIAKKDAFLEVLTPFDRQIRMKLKREVSEEEFLTFYKDQVLDCHLNDQTSIDQYYEQIKPKLTQLGIKLPTLTMIRTTGKEEIPGTAAYCRNNAIVFNFLSEKLFVHELFHIYSRNNPEMRKKLYALIGYEICPPIAIPDALKEKRLVNPDVPYIDAFITVKYKGQEVCAVPIDLYDVSYQGRGKNPFLKGIYHKFAIVEPLHVGEMQFKLDAQGNPFLFDFEEAEGLTEKIGENTTYIDSPEEILADNFAYLILGKDVATPRIIEDMRRCFLQLENPIRPAKKPKKTAENPQEMFDKFWASLDEDEQNSIRAGNDDYQQVYRNLCYEKVEIGPRVGLDPRINKNFFALTVQPEREIPQPPEVDLNELVLLFDQYVSIDSALISDDDTPATYSELQTSMKTLIAGTKQKIYDTSGILDKLLKHLCYFLKKENISSQIKEYWLIELARAGKRECPTRMRSACRQGYEALSGDIQLVSLQDHVVKIYHDLRVQIIKDMAKADVHREGELLIAIGKQLNIQNTNLAYNDDPLWMYKLAPQRSLPKFFKKCTAQKIVDCFTKAINSKKIDSQLIWDWFLENIPQDFHPEMSKEERRSAFIECKDYAENGLFKEKGVDYLLTQLPTPILTFRN